MMFGKFKKKSVDVAVYAPVSGKVIALELVADEVFRSKMMGDGVAFVPKSNTIYSPCDGTIAMIALTNHAFGIKASNGLDVLIHVGLNSVNLKGEGFKVLVKVNQEVTKGTPMLDIDMDIMKLYKIDLTTPMIVTNNQPYVINDAIYNTTVLQGSTIILTTDP